MTLVSVDGAYGGPVSVAVGQCAALAEAGHRVTLLTGWDGKAPHLSGSFTARRFRLRRVLPVGGFAALASLRMLASLARHAREWDVVHVHLARDLVTLPAAAVCRWRGVPLVVQTHGMVVPDGRLRSRALDRIAVRGVLRGARAHLVLTQRERDEVLALAPGRTNVVEVGNGIAPSRLRARPAGTGDPEVVFLARLHPRKRVLAFAQMAALLVEAGVRARFTVLGPDEGDLPALRGRLSQPAMRGRLVYGGALPPAAVRERLATAQVLVLPSRDEPFPITVLEAWSVGLPAVLTASNGLAPALSAVDPGLVVPGTPASLAAAVVQLLADERTWQQSAARATELVTGRFGMPQLVAALERAYGAPTRTPVSARNDR